MLCIFQFFIEFKMPNLKEVKNRIVSVNSTQQITKAMKMVSASKLRKAQERVAKMPAFVEKFEAIFQQILASIDAEVIQSIISAKKQSTKHLFVIITSDRGLCGGFNSSVCKAAMQQIQDAKVKSKDVAVLNIGKKGYDIFKNTPYKLYTQYVDTFNNLDYEKAIEIATFLKEKYERGAFGKIHLFYNKFKNVAVQILTKELFLPFDINLKDQKNNSPYMIIEPDAVSVAKLLFTKSLYQKLFLALLNSNAAEHGARMTTMDKATDNASELLKELRLVYNRTRQAVITKEIIEIVSGAQALSGT